MGFGAGTHVCPLSLGDCRGEGQAYVALCELTAWQAVQLHGFLRRARRPTPVLHKEGVLHQDLQ